MLVLSRKLDESIQIGDDILITVVDIRGEKIRLGITAPKGVGVHRQEIYREIQRMARQLALKPENQSPPTPPTPAAPAATPTPPTGRKQS